MEIISQYYFLLVIIFSTYLLFLAVSNVLFLNRQSRKAAVFTGPMVSVLVPARNEEENIAACLDSLLDQSYTDYEIIVLDDQSTDGTRQIIEAYAGRHKNIRLIHGQPLQKSWYGKPQAMQQLGNAAKGEYLMFTDADTVHTPDSIAWAVTNITHHKCDFISAYPHHKIMTLGEHLTVPVMYLLSAVILPLWLIPNTRTPLLSHALGQIMLIKRSVFREIDGFTQVRGRVSEDVHLSRLLKRLGYRTIFLDCKDNVSCRMYSGMRCAINGMTKNVYDFFDNNVPLFFFIVSTFYLFAIMPFLLVVYGAIFQGAFILPAAVSSFLFLLAWHIVLHDRRQVWYQAFLYPLQMAFLVLMLVVSFGKSYSGAGFVWKGRLVK